MSSSIIVTGGLPLSGKLRVGGAKNSALKLIAAALLAPGVTRITNVPDIADVATMAEVVSGLGAHVERADHTLTVDATSLSSHEAPYDVVARMRASIVVLGPLLARLGEARVAMPGGCNIGSRKIDMHLAGLAALGVEFESAHGYIHAHASELTGAHVVLDFPSVGATENLLMAAVRAKGTTIIENAAREPEIQDLAAFLVAMGAQVEGSGTPTITIEGVDELVPCEHAVVGDRIEAGTYLMAGALCGGPVTVDGFDPHHLELVLSKMASAGVRVRTGDRSATVERAGRPAALDVQTLPYPGFPTDMQPQWMALMATSEGSCVVTENVFESRFMFADELVRMGADVRIEGHHALIKGVERLSAAPARCPDLRAGAALVLAGLAADGDTLVRDVQHIDRGYEGFVEKLTALGARVVRSEATDLPAQGD